jgi:hypothetical protein
MPASSPAASGTGSARSLGRAFGVLSAALGLPAVAAPRLLAPALGLRPTGRTSTTLRLVGARELLAAGGLLAGVAPRGMLGARVAGDVVDLTLLARALPRRGRRRSQVLRTTAIVGAITAADVAAVVVAGRLARSGDPGPGIAAVTVNRRPGDVERAWRQHRPEIAGGGRTTFAPAPGGRGTEVTVVIEQRPASPLQRTVRKVRGTDPVQQAHDELRRFKQLVETGEITRSDALPEGARTADLLKQRPAQPLGAERAGEVAMNGAHR